VLADECFSPVYLISFGGILNQCTLIEMEVISEFEKFALNLPCL